MRDLGLAPDQIVDREVGGVAAVGVDEGELRSGFLSATKVSSDTPCHFVSSFDHLVTQWMSTVISSSSGRDRNCSQFHDRGWSTDPPTESDH